MSSGQGGKKGKGRGKSRRGRGRGRGSEPREQSESVPGGLQQHVSEESEGATAVSVVQPEPQPTEHTPKQQEAPGTSSQKKRQSKGKKKQQSRSEDDDGSLKPQPEQPQQVPQTHPPSQPSPQPQLPAQPPQPLQTQPPPAQPHPQSQPPEPQPPPQTKPPPTQPSLQPQSPPQAQASKKSKPQTQQIAISPAPLRSDKTEIRPPRRPDGGGKVGRPIKLRVNFLPVKLPLEDIHHYDTEIKAKGCKRGEGYTSKEAPKIIQAMVEQYQKANPSGPKLVYDKNGKNLYCKSSIPGIGKDKREYKIIFTTDNGKEREYTVQVQWTSQVSLYNLNQALEGKLTEIPRDTLQAVEVVLRHLPSMNSIPVQSSFYTFLHGEEKDLGQGLQMWNGTFVSIRPTQWKMMLNIDTCAKAFYKAQPVLHFMCEYLGLRDIPQRLNEQQRKNFAKEINTIKVETTHVKRKQKASGLSRNSARRETFDCEGTQTTVFDYFKSKYGITLQYPDLPCVKIGQKGTCVPIELCKIVQGQPKQGRLSAKQTQQMIRHTALPAPQRQQEIAKLIRNANYDQDPFCQDFGIKIGHDMAQITGRVLDPPVIAYGPTGSPMKESPRDGVWNMQQKPMFTPKHLNEWALISFENPQYLNDRGIDNFIDKLVMVGEEKGIQIHSSPCHREIQRGYQNTGRLFGKLNKNYPNLQLIIAMFPEKGNTDPYYEEVKYHGDVVYGILTQCVKTRKTDMQTMANICLKINAKLGGTGCVLDRGIRSPILARPVIIFGADVTHPSPRDKTTPSIAAVVASMDSHPNLYSAEVRVQEHRKEVIADLKDMVKELLKKFRGKTGAKPEKIIFYRDGVSEGQFKEVLLYELQAIQHACLELHASFKPAITFIVVQKRHHTRFFAENPRDQRGKSKNIPAGTVVDKYVCHPFEFDWYLCSHAGIQGTSKPAHYHVLYDDSNLKSDDLQILTNQLCHTYVRCARAVSIPAPAYYAHHVAFRARYHLNEVDRNNEDTRSESSGGDGVNLKMEEMAGAVKIHQRMATTMYFA